MMPPIPGAQEPRPYAHARLTAYLSAYLHTCGAVQDPEENQVEGDVPAVFHGNIPPEPDRAIGIIGPWINNPDSDTLPQVRFMIVQRTPPWDQVSLEVDAQRIHRALQRPDHSFPLTADQHLAYCRWVVSDPPVQDDSQRWIRVTTYEARVAPPSTTNIV